MPRSVARTAADVRMIAAAAARRGMAMPTITALADVLGVTTHKIVAAYAALDATGSVRVRRGGQGKGVTVVEFVGGGATAAAVPPVEIPSALLAGIEVAERAAHMARFRRGEAAVRMAADKAGPVQRRVHCPWCNSPPGSALCAHGWDGETTRAARREAARRIGAARRVS